MDWKDRTTKGVDCASGMFDTDVKGKINKKKLKGKLATNKEASTGRWTHTREAWHKEEHVKATPRTHAMLCTQGIRDVIFAIGSLILAPD